MRVPECSTKFFAYFYVSKKKIKQMKLANYI